MFKKYLISIVVLSLFCIMNVYAQFAGGSGTEVDPYQVATAEHLNNVRDYLNSYFIQTASIDLGVAPWNINEGWEPIGTYDNSFTGSYDGNGFFIGNLMIDRTTTNYVGLFGYFYGAILQNIEIENIDVTGNDHVGGLVGSQSYSSNVSNSHTSGIVVGFGNYVGGLVGSSGLSTIINSYANCSVTGDSYIGGLVGQNYTASVSNSYAIGSVEGYDGKIGGLVGYNGWSSTIINSHANCSVTGTSYYSHSIGGLVGINNSSTVTSCYTIGSAHGSGAGSRYRVGGLVGWNCNSIITDSYSTSSVLGSGQVGGLVGFNNFSTISNTYAIGNVYGSSSSIGGLVGSSDSTSVTNNSYWNTSTTGQSTSNGGFPRTTDEMTYPYATNTYLFWDFTDIWADDENYTINNGYPYLYQYPLSVEEFIVTFPKSVISNFPNPFNPETTISLSLYAHDINKPISVEIYNLKGQLVRTLFNEIAKKRAIYITWNGTNNKDVRISSGIYLIRLKTATTNVSRKVMMIK